MVVPGWSDDDKSVHILGDFTQHMSNIERIEFLPYHELGKHKWIAMGEESALRTLNRRPPRAWIKSVTFWPAMAIR